MRFNLTVEVEDNAIHMFDDLLTALHLNSGTFAVQPMALEQRKCGTVFDSAGNCVGNWEITHSEACLNHGPIALAHFQHGEVKTALWCVKCQEFYPLNL
jgi:hypothetical protein